MGRSVLICPLVALLCALAGCREPAPDGGRASSAAEEPPLIVEPFGPPTPPDHDTPKPIRVLVGGDLIPHRPSLVEPASIRAALAPLAPTFSSADMVVANYEAATGEVNKKAFRLAYAAPPEWLDELPRAGIGAVTVANNHACDLGLEGLEATLDATKHSGAVAIGGDPKDPWAARPLVERGGRRVCAVAWTTLVNAEGGCARTVRLAVAPLDRKGKAQIDTALTRARSWCDATIAILHGGQEYVAQRNVVLEQARHAAESGAAAVVIHHPHIASPVVVHATKDGRRVPIFASVGNLVSNQGESWKPPMFPVLRENRRLVCVNGWTRLGVLADLSFSWDDKGAQLDWGFHLTWTENEHADDKTIEVPKIATRLLDPDRDGEVVDRLQDDEVGPVELFEDPCWVERPLYATGDVEKDARCAISTPKNPPPQTKAVARVKKRRR